MGDARLTMERQSPQKSDLLVLDAFSGDSVPVHLLTKEAMDIYRRHVGPDDVIAIHTTNRYLYLFPVVRALAEDAQSHGGGFIGPLTASATAAIGSSSAGSRAYWMRFPKYGRCGNTMTVLRSPFGPIRAIISSASWSANSSPSCDRGNFQFWTGRELGSLFRCPSIARRPRRISPAS